MNKVLPKNLVLAVALMFMMNDAQGSSDFNQNITGSRATSSGIISDQQAQDSATADPTQESVPVPPPPRRKKHQIPSAEGITFVGNQQHPSTETDVVEASANTDENEQLTEGE